ncbi:hypothetical protein PROVRUST_07283 [Providencia rustigianii DSM 4541]|uniref:Uncharacterized protein n=3 Tax=Providencia rustigianii TaxID=158850 RepID=D1P4X9_9GAMM|nr:hypothetical protein PROVRUST_07283 [Providencia rustigianii DSM 4541]
MDISSVIGNRKGGRFIFKLVCGMKNKRFLMEGIEFIAINSERKRIKRYEKSIKIALIKRP